MSSQRSATRQRLDYDLIDADHHYYETYDCFTRHIEPEFADRAVNVRVDDKGRGKLFFGDRQFRFMRVIQTDYIGAPGSLRQMLDDGDNKDGFVHRDVIRGWDYPDMMQRGPAWRRWTSRGCSPACCWAPMALQTENELHDDIPALYANIRSYNRWLDEEWGFNRDGRIITAALISLIDPERAIAELDRLVAAGARAVVMKPGPLWGHSPVEPMYDGFWSRLAGRRREAGLPQHRPALHLDARGRVRRVGDAVDAGPDPVSVVSHLGQAGGRHLGVVRPEQPLRPVPPPDRGGARVRDQLGGAAAARHRSRRPHGPEGSLAWWRGDRAAERGADGAPLRVAVLRGGRRRSGSMPSDQSGCSSDRTTLTPKASPTPSIG